MHAGQWFISSVGGNKIVTVDITGDNRLLQKRLEDILRRDDSSCCLFKLACSFGFVYKMHKSFTV